MDDHDPLKRVAEHLGYSQTDINRLMAALREEGEMRSVRAAVDRTGLTELKTPLSAMGESAQNARTLKMVCGQIRHLSAQRYSLPLDKPVDLDELSAAIRGGDVASRIAVKAALKRLGLIP